MRRLVGMLARRGYRQSMAFDVVKVALANERERQGRSCAWPRTGLAAQRRRAVSRSMCDSFSGLRTA